MDIIKALGAEFKIKNTQVSDTVKLMDEGNTIPFIARYRKEVTGGLSDEVLRDLNDRLIYLRNLEERKEEVIRLIDEQGKLTEQLRTEIRAAQILQRVEDLYKPFKKKKATRASRAKEKGLEPLADIIRAQEAKSADILTIASGYTDEVTGVDNGVETAEDALTGACDIIAEHISDDPEITAAVREKTATTGIINTEAADPGEKTVYEMYYEYSEGIAKIPNHRVLAINRGEKEKKLKVKVLADVEKIESIIGDVFGIREKTVWTELLRDTVRDAYKRLIAPSIEREMRNMLTERAEAEAIKVFAKNTEKLLMVPPVRGARVIAIDPGYRTGCKVAVLDETGKLKGHTTVYPTEPRKEVAKTQATLKMLVEKYSINTIVIGNGTASRETEEVVADFIGKYKEKSPDSPLASQLRYTIVNEAGASVYSASKLATEEYPNLDVTVRGAMSLGRRLQDPLAELVKIPTRSIGVGQYQHDINQSLLENALSGVVEDCVNKVGVNLNTASSSLLSYVAGINMGIAKNIVAYREKNGAFQERKELKKVPKLGEKTFGQCAGFIRIPGGKNPLDNTAVHPESYGAAEALLELLGLDKSVLAGEENGLTDIDLRIKARCGSREQLADDLGIGLLTLEDIIGEMKKPGRDPRDDAPEVIFRNDVKSFEDLKIDMELEGTVRNVVDFGAFVDIGVKNDGLVHISEMSSKYIRHPMDIVSVGDIVKVRIIKIDYDRKRVGLTMK